MSMPGFDTQTIKERSQQPGFFVDTMIKGAENRANMQSEKLSWNNDDSKRIEMQGLAKDMQALKASDPAAFDKLNETLKSVPAERQFTKMMEQRPDLLRANLKEIANSPDPSTLMEKIRREGASTPAPVHAEKFVFAEKPAAPARPAPMEVAATTQANDAVVDKMGAARARVEAQQAATAPAAAPRAAEPSPVAVAAAGPASASEGILQRMERNQVFAPVKPPEGIAQTYPGAAASASIAKIGVPDSNPPRPGQPNPLAALFDSKNDGPNTGAAGGGGGMTDFINQIKPLLTMLVALFTGKSLLSMGNAPEINQGLARNLGANPNIAEMNQDGSIRQAPATAGPVINRQDIQMGTSGPSTAPTLGMAGP